MKKIDKKIYNMTNLVFKEEMNLLLDMEEKFPYDNKLSNNKSRKKKIAIVYDVDGWAFNNIAIEIKNIYQKISKLTFSQYLFLMIIL